MAEAPLQNPNVEPSRIKLVIDRLHALTYGIVKPHLDARHEADPAAGIAIVHFAGTIEPIRSADGQDYHFHAARIFPGQKNFVNPHYHLKGEEPYEILAGDNGEMNLGRVLDGEVEWNEPRQVKAGDTVNVQEGEVHSLRNNSDVPLDFVFACPDNHLNEIDRFFTKDLSNGIPPWYQKKTA